MRIAAGRLGSVDVTLGIPSAACHHDAAVPSSLGSDFGHELSMTGGVEVC
jgi:hypothetical protein